MKKEINIKCENDDDRDLIFEELINIIRKLGDEGKIRGKIEYGF